MTNPASISRRSALSLAAATGLLAAAGPPVLPSAAASPPSAAATPGTGTSALRRIAPGAGTKRIYKDVFPSLTFLDMLVITDTAGIPKLVTATSGSTNQFQVCDAATGRREYAATAPEGRKLAATLAWDPATGTVYAASDGAVLSWSFATKQLVSLGLTAPEASGTYSLALDSAGGLWGGSYPGGIVWRYDPKNRKFTPYPPLDELTDYVKALAIWKETVFVGTGSRNPHIVSFPMSDPTRRTVLKLPNAPAAGFVHRLLARGDKLIVFAEDDANATRRYVYDLLKGAWINADGLNPLSSPFSAAQGNITWRAAGSLLLRTDTGLMTETTVCPTGVALARSIYVSGDQVLVAGSHSGEPVVAEYSLRTKTEVRRVRPDLLAGSLKVQSLIGSDHGLLYLGGYQGDGIASLDPGTDVRWRSRKTAGIAQIEHLMQYDGNRLYIGSYGSAKLYSFDRNRIAEGDAAFTLVTNLRKTYMQSRPFAWTAAGGKVLAGTVPEYGLRGGALAVIDPVTNRLQKVLNKFIPEQSIVGLAGYGDIAYGTTSGRGGYGIDDYSGDACVFAYNARTDQTLWVAYLKGHRDLYSPMLVDGILYVATINGLLALAPADGTLQQTLAVRNRTARPGYQTARAHPVPRTSKIVHSSGSTVMLIDVKEHTQSVLVQTGAGTPLAVMPDGRVFVAYQHNHIAELHLDSNPTISSGSDLVTINAAGELLIAASDGVGKYSPAVRHGTGWQAATIRSFHVTDWNGDGIPDILVQRTNGNLEWHRGKVNGGFEAPVVVAYGWAAKTMTVGPWVSSIYPTVIGLDAAGRVRRHPVGAGGTIGAGYLIGTGWKGRNITMIDMSGSGRAGLLGRSGARLYFQPSNGKGSFEGPAVLAASAGWSDTTALASVQGHYRDSRGLLSVKRSGWLQYVSSIGTRFAGVITYPMDLRGSFLAGSGRF